MTTPDPIRDAQAASTQSLIFPAPGHDLHHSVIMAISALRAIVSATDDQNHRIPRDIAGLFHAVDFIVDGLQTAADAFESADRGEVAA